MDLSSCRRAPLLCSKGADEPNKPDVDITSELSKLQTKITELECRNKELLNTRAIETEQLRIIVEKYTRWNAQKDKQIMELKGMLMDREGEVQRLREALEIAEEQSNAQI